MDNITPYDLFLAAAIQGLIACETCVASERDQKQLIDRADAIAKQALAKRAQRAVDER